MVNKNEKKVLITGATGFVGAHLVESFSARGWTVVCPRREGSDLWRLDYLKSKGVGFEEVLFDLEDFESVGKTLLECSPDVVVHSAAYGVDYREQSYDKAVSVNILATLNLIKESANSGVSRFIHVGTCYEYGTHSGLISEKNLLSPIGVYGATKAAASILSIERAKELNLPLIVLRPFAMYGPMEGGHKLIPMVIKSCLDKKKLALTPGEQVRDYMFVCDFTNLVADIVEKEKFPQNRIFNVGSGAALPVKELCEKAGEVVGNGLNWLDFGAKQNRVDEIKSIVADTGAIKNVMGWKVSTSIEDGMKRTMSYYKEQ